MKRKRKNSKIESIHALLLLHPFSRLSYLSIVCLLLLNLSSCLEPEEGCLDVLATNFDAAADEDCAGCCDFPELTLVFEHNMGENALVLGSDYTTDSLQYFTLIDLRYFLSEVLVSGPNLQLRFLDSFNISVLENGSRVDKRVANNLKLIRRTVTSATFGRFLEYGLIDTLRFSVGVPELLNTAFPDDFPNTYPLNTQAESMYWNPDSGYIFNHLTLNRDTMSGSDTLYLSIGLDPRRVDIALPYADTLNRATDLRITLEVDYLQWFQGINFESDLEEEIVEKIVNNTSKAFSIKE